MRNAKRIAFCVRMRAEVLPSLDFALCLVEMRGRHIAVTLPRGPAPSVESMDRR